MQITNVTRWSRRRRLYFSAVDRRDADGSGRPAGPGLVEGLECFRCEGSVSFHDDRRRHGRTGWRSAPCLPGRSPPRPVRTRCLRTTPAATMWPRRPTPRPARGEGELGVDAPCHPETAARKTGTAGGDRQGRAGLIEHADGHGDLLRLGHSRSSHSVHRWGRSSEPAVRNGDVRLRADGSSMGPTT